MLPLGLRMDQSINIDSPEDSSALFMHKTSESNSQVSSWKWLFYVLSQQGEKKLAARCITRLPGDRQPEPALLPAATEPKEPLTCVTANQSCGTGFFLP